MNTQQPMWPQLGAFSYGIATVDKLITACHTYGLTTVQLGEAILEQALADPQQAREIRSALEQQGIQVVALAGYRNIVAPDTQVLTKNKEFIERCLQVAPLLGKPIVATETGTRNRENEWHGSPDNQGTEAWALLRETIGELVAQAERYGSVLALEGYVNNVIDTPERMAALLEEYPTAHLQMVLDPYNYLSHDLLPRSVDIIEQFLLRFKDRFVIAHLKDVSTEGAEIDTPEFGLGVFPQAPYIEFLRTERPDLPLILEHLPWEHLPAAIKRLQDTIDLFCR